MQQMTSAKSVLIVGGGAAGCSAAFSLGRYPDKFKVQVWEKRDVAGGVACTTEIPGGLFINDGVQGGTPTYRNTLNIMKKFNLTTHPVHMMVSFGKGKNAWTNYKRSDLTDRLKNDIQKFERVLKIINRFEGIFIFLSIDTVLHWFGFSKDFANHMVYPLTALFFGTGNQTPNVSAAIVARVFLDDDLRLFDYDAELLLSQKPEMFAFPNLQEMYSKISHGSKNVKFVGGKSVKRVIRKSGQVRVVDDEDKEEIFDEIIFACDAETALNSLESPTFYEKRALGNVSYFNDLIVTHEDEEYMQKHYELTVDKDQYFIRTDPFDAKKIEMSFNLSNYQPQLKNCKRNIYQTIFLDDKVRDIWTVDEINKDKILLQKWWRQFAHSWQHYAFAVPLMRFIQGHNNSWYCGAYTLINTHEIATISGLAVAHRLGAPYPFEEDDLARKQFDQYLLVIHGQPRRFGFNKYTAASFLLRPIMFIFSLFSLFLRLFF